MRTTRLSAALAGGAVLLLAGSASAHVTVNAPGATQGGFAKLTFRVPTEKDVPTTKLEIAFPADSPLAFASVKPHAGWTYKVVKAKLATPIKSDDGDVTEAVSTITWTADNGGIKPGEFDEFEVSAGPLPEKDTMTFKALQTYSDGSVVRWIEAGADSEHPAPVLTLAAASDSSRHGSDPSATPSASASATPTVTATAETEGDDNDPLGIAGLVVGGLGLLVALVALARGRRTA